MKTYDVLIERIEYYSTFVPIKAESKEKAEEIGEQMMDNQKFYDSLDYTGFDRFAEASSK